MSIFSPKAASLPAANGGNIEVNVGTGTPVFQSTPIYAPILEPTNTPGFIQESGGNTKPFLQAFIQAPNGNVEKPYVIITGIQTFSGNSNQITLSGNIFDKTFFCPVSSCLLQIPESGRITIRASTTDGLTSDPLQASIQITQTSAGYKVTIESLSQFTLFSDSCANIWQNGETPPPIWASFYQNPQELNTQKSLYYLASRLLSSGVVNGSSCPGMGFDSNSPNPCGLALVKDEMVKWQNQYDLNIWLASRDEHIPPIILKTLLEIESQFWPTTQRLFLDELGLGQVNQLGIDVLLRTDPALYQKVCTTALYDCKKPYISLNGVERALIRGTLVQSMDATCPSCLYGVNVVKASQSIPLISKVLYSNCVQTNNLLKSYSLNASYEDSWIFTLISYHSGIGCLQHAIDLTSSEPDGKVTWAEVSKNINCPGSINYIDRFWTTMESFPTYQKKNFDLPVIQLISQAPIPIPTNNAGNSRIIVKIFIDLNGNGIQEPGETMNNVQVNLALDNGISKTQIAIDGSAIFVLQGISVGVNGTVSLPGLYKSASFKVQSSGDQTIVFVFSKPILPTTLP